MSTTRAIGALSLLSIMACDGPTLRAGTYATESDASQVADARVDDDDEGPGDDDDQVGVDAGRSRDGGRNDAGEWRYPIEERRRCTSAAQCDNNIFNRICSANFGMGTGMCVECTIDEHCARFGPRPRCDEVDGFCREFDRGPRP